MSGTHGVFQHCPGYFYTMLEEDFCEVYKAEGKNEVCRAYITSILEHLTNKQYETTGSDTDIWVFMSLPEMSKRMRHAFGERTIHKEIQGMIKDGFLFKRRAYGKATMEYKLNLRKLRKALEALPEKQSCNNATYHLANLQDQSGIIARSTLQNYKNDLAELQPRITIEETLEVPENKEREGAFASAHTSLAFEKSHIIFEHYAGNETLYYHSACVDGHYGASEGMILTAVGIERAPQEAICGMCQSSVHQAPFSDVEDDDRPTEKAPVVKPTNETPYHIAERAIGNEQLAIPGRLTLPSKIGASTHESPGHRHTIGSTRSDTGINLDMVEGDTQSPPGDQNRVAFPQPTRESRHSACQGVSQGVETSQQTPGTVQAQPSLLLGPEPAQAAFPPAARSASAPGTAQATGKPEKPRRGRKQEVQLTLHEQEIKEWYEELRGVEISLSKRTVTALAALGKRTMSKDDFLSVTAILDSDKWFEEHKIGVDLYWIERQWDNKIVFLRGRKKPGALADTKKPAPGTSGFDIYKGNGVEEREQSLRDYEERERNGTLLW